MSNHRVRPALPGRPALLGRPTLPVLLGLPGLIVVLGLNQMQRLNPSPNPNLNGVPVQNIRINRVV